MAAVPTVPSLLLHITTVLHVPVRSKVCAQIVLLKGLGLGLTLTP
jgi:hypothetical protein